MYNKKTVSLINHEMEQVCDLFQSYDSLLKKCKVTEPDLVEITAVASVLHSFYSGIENVFLTIAKRVDEEIPRGQQWHRALLTQMSKTSIGNRNEQVISEGVVIRLSEYLGFRHFYRHAYSFMLNWQEMKRLVHELGDTWELVQNEMTKYIKMIEKE